MVATSQILLGLMAYQYISDGKVTEFNDLQQFHDFIVDKTRHRINGEWIIFQRRTEKFYKWKWFVLGFMAGMIIGDFLAILLHFI